MVLDQQQVWQQLLTAVGADARMCDLVGVMAGDPVASFGRVSDDAVLGEVFWSADSVDAWVGLAALLQADRRAVTVDWDELPTNLFGLIEDLPVIAQTGLDTAKVEALVELLDDLDAPGLDRMLVAVAFVNAWLALAGLALVHWDTDSDSYTFVAAGVGRAADIVSAGTALGKEAAVPALTGLLA